MDYLQNLSPINQLVVLVAFIGLLFGFLVVYLDNSKDYALKRDWRDKDSKQSSKWIEKKLIAIALLNGNGKYSYYILYLPDDS